VKKLKSGWKRIKKSIGLCTRAGAFGLSTRGSAALFAEKLRFSGTILN
jgi:hypothetical protein